MLEIGARPIYGSKVARKKLVTTVYLEPNQDRHLKALSKKTKIPVAAFIRQGIDLVLAANQHLLPGQLHLFDEDEAEGAPVALDHKELTVRSAAVHRAGRDSGGGQSE